MVLSTIKFYPVISAIVRDCQRLQYFEGEPHFYLQIYPLNVTLERHIPLSHTCLTKRSEDEEVDFRDS